MRTSLYADDAAIFVAPIKEDILNLASILEGFGEVTGLCTNFHKSSVVPIRCGQIDLDAILQDLGLSQGLARDPHYFPTPMGGSPARELVAYDGGGPEPKP